MVLPVESDPKATLAPGARSGGRARSLAARGCAAFTLAVVVAGAPPLLAAASEDDEAYVLPLVNQALETEKTDVEIPWANPETGNRGIIVVERTFYRDEQPCRDYKRTVQGPDSAPMVIEGTGCRVGRGRWELDEEPPKEMSRAQQPPQAMSGRQTSPGQPAAGPADEQSRPQQSGQAAAPSGAQTASRTETGSEPDAPSEEAPAERARASEDAAETEAEPDTTSEEASAEAAPPEPPPFPDYSMPSSANP